MALLNKKQIQKAGETKTVPHFVKEWGGDVNIKVLKLSERIEIEESFLLTLEGEDGAKQMNNKDFQKLSATIVVAAVVDKDGKQLFDNTEELYELSGAIPKIINELYSIATGISEAKKSEAPKSEISS